MIRNQRVHEIIFNNEYLKEMYFKDHILNVAANLCANEVELIEHLHRCMRGAMAMSADAILNQTPVVLMQQPNTTVDRRAQDPDLPRQDT